MANLVLKNNTSGGKTSVTADSFIGNASTASKWLTARTLTLAGDASGSVSIDGSENMTLTVAVADSSHNHAASNITSGTLAIARIPTITVAKGGTGATDAATARTNFIETAKTLTSVLNAKSSQLSELTSKALGDGETQELLEGSKIYNEYTVFNNKLEELAEVNKALQVTQTGTLHANNLLDQRDMILNDIAQFVDINIEENPKNGSVDLYIGNIAMVKGAEVHGELELQTAKSYCDSAGLNYPTDWVVKDEAGDFDNVSYPRETHVKSYKV